MNPQLQVPYVGASKYELPYKRAHSDYLLNEITYSLGGLGEIEYALGGFDLKSFASNNKVLLGVAAVAAYWYWKKK